MKGAIFLKNVGKSTVSGVIFTENDPGPLLEDEQKIGLDMRSDYDENLRDVSYLSVARASTIYIDQDDKDIAIKDSTFTNNMLDFAKSYLNLKLKNKDLYDLFPEGYFEASHSPLINVVINK